MKKILNINSVRKAKFRQKGFTLIEVLITVAIIGIIGGIAYPSYLDSLRKGFRTDATESLMRLAIAQEKFYIQNGTYTTEISAATGLNNGSTESSNNYYTLKAEKGSSGDIKTSFKLTATAKGSQAKDTYCAVFNIDSKGQRTGTNTDCW